MRILGLVIFGLATVLVSAAAQTRAQGDTSQDSTHAQGYRPYADPGPSTGYPGNIGPDTVRTATTNADPYLQRYYSETEGWTYYNLPKSSSGRRSDDEQ